MDFNNILIGSEDPGRLAAFYTKLFGEPGWDEDGYVGWMIGTGAFVIGAHDRVHGENQEPGRLIWNIESEDVHGDFERLKSAGAQVIQAPYDMNSEDMGTMAIATFADPDGHYFQLVSPMSMPA
jgi:predicted enzyme related to lactoylglutathione lyase